MPSFHQLLGSVPSPQHPVSAQYSAEWFAVKQQDNSLESLAKTRQAEMKRQQQRLARQQLQQHNETHTLWSSAPIAPFEESSHFSFLATPVPQASMQTASRPVPLPSAAQVPAYNTGRQAPPPASTPSLRAVQSAQKQPSRAAQRSSNPQAAKPSRGKRGKKVTSGIAAQHQPLQRAVSSQDAAAGAQPFGTAKHSHASRSATSRSRATAHASQARAPSTSSSARTRGVSRGASSLAQAQQAQQAASASHRPVSKAVKGASRSKSAAVSRVGRPAGQRVAISAPEPVGSSSSGWEPGLPDAQGPPPSARAQRMKRAKSAAKVPLHRAAMQAIVEDDVAEVGSLQAAAMRVVPTFAPSKRSQSAPRSAARASKALAELEKANELSFGHDEPFMGDAPDCLNHIGHSRHFPTHLEDYQVLEEVKRGRVFCGLLTCAKNAQGRSGSVFIPSLACSIVIPSSYAMNRALHGDLVAVRLDRGSGLGATRGGAKASVDASVVSQAVLASAQAGDVMAISSALRSMASARVGTVVRILRREHTRPFVARIVKFNSWQVIPLDTRFPRFSLLQQPGETSREFRGKLFLAFLRPETWTGMYPQPRASVPGGLASALPLDMSKRDDAVLAFQIEQGAVVGAMSDDPTTKQHQERPGERLPWLGDVHGVKGRWAQWHEFCTLASQFCANWSMEWSDALSRSGQAGNTPAAAFRAVEEHDFLLPCLQAHVPNLVERSFRNAPSEDETSRLQQACIIPCLSMDPHGSVALDDAVSVVPLPQSAPSLSTLPDATHRMFVHIADPIFVLSGATGTAGSQDRQVAAFRRLVLAAVQRACSFYTSDWGLKAHQGMVPPAIAQASSLAGGAIRPALTIVLDISTTQKTTQLVCMGPSLVYNVAPLTYEQGQQVLSGTSLQTDPFLLPDAKTLGPTNKNYSSLIVTPPALTAAVRNLKEVTTAVNKRRMRPRGDAAQQHHQHDLTAASISKLLKSNADSNEDGSLEAHGVIAEVMQLANGVVGLILATQASESSIFLAQPPPPVQSLSVLQAYCAHLGVPLNPAEFGFYTWPHSSLGTQGPAVGVVENSDADLLTTTKRVFSILMQRGQYISGAVLLNRPDILPDLLTVRESASSSLLHGSTAQPAVDFSAAEELVSQDMLDNIPLAFHNCSLGYNAYTNFTSPLRKGTDLLVHAQLHTLLKSANADMLQSVTSTGSNLDKIVQHLNNARSRTRSLQQTSEDIALRLHMRRQRTWAAVQLGAQGQIVVPAFRGATVLLPPHVQGQQRQSVLRIGDAVVQPRLTNASLFHTPRRPTANTETASLDLDDATEAAWALFHVSSHVDSVETSRFELSALAYPIAQHFNCFPEAQRGNFGTDAAAESASEPEKQPFLQVHFEHLDEKSSLSVLPTHAVSRKTTVCFSMTHYLADFLPSLWAELLDSSIADQPKGRLHTAVNVMAMFDGADPHRDVWGEYLLSRAARKSSTTSALRPKAALWVTDIADIVSHANHLPARVPNVTDLPVGTPDARSIGMQHAVHIVQHPPDSRRIAIPANAGDTLLPEHSPRIKRVNTMLLPPEPVPMAGRTATLLLPAAAVAEPSADPQLEEGLIIRAGYAAVVSIPSISWRACAFVRSVARKRRIIPEASPAQLSLEVYAQSSTGLRCSGMLQNSVVAVSVMFMHGAPSLPDCLVNFVDHVDSPQDLLMGYSALYGLQLQLIPTPPSQERNLRILADMHQLSSAECVDESAESLIDKGVSFSLQRDPDPAAVQAMADSLAMSQTCFAAQGIKPLTRSGSQLLRDIVCGWRQGEGAVASFANDASDWLLTDMLPDAVLSQELFSQNTVEALQMANPDASFDTSLAHRAGAVALLSEGDLTILAPELNQQQKQALKQALSSQVTLLHGPPGTGKTTTASRMIFFFALSNIHCAVAAGTLAQAQAETLAGMEDVLVDYTAPMYVNLADEDCLSMLPRQVHFCAPSHRAVNVLGRQLWRKLPQWCTDMNVPVPSMVQDLGVADARQALRQPRFTTPPFICAPVEGQGGGSSAAARGGSNGWGAPSADLWGAPTAAMPPVSTPVTTYGSSASQTAFKAAEQRFQAHLRHIERNPPASLEAEVAQAAAAHDESDVEEWRRFRDFAQNPDDRCVLTTVRVFPQHSALRDIQRLWRESVADSLTDNDALMLERIADHGAVPSTLTELELAACTVQGRLDTLAAKPGQAPSKVPDFLASESQDVPVQYPRASCLHHLARDPAVCPHALEVLCVELVLRLEAARVHFGCPVKIYSSGVAYNQVPAVIAAGCGDEDALEALRENVHTSKTFAPPNATSLQPRYLLQRHKTASTAAENYVLSFAHVLLTTAAEAGSSRFDKATAPRQVIVDEAAFCGELECLVPVPRASKVVFIGDHKQLPPVLSVRATNLQEKLKVSLFERLVERAIMLRTQYRMHPAIAAFPSRYFYNSELRSGSDMQQKRRLAFEAMPHMFADAGQFPIRFVQVQGIERNLRRGTLRTEDSELSQHVQTLLDTLPAEVGGEGGVPGAQAPAEVFGRGGLGHTLPVEYYTRMAQPSVEGHLQRASLGTGSDSLLGFARAVQKAKPAGARSVAMAALRLSKATDRHSCPVAAALTGNPTSIANVEEAVMTVLTLASTLASGKLLPHQVAIVSPYRAQVVLLQSLLAVSCFPVLRGSPLAKWAAERGASAPDSIRGMAVAEPFSQQACGGQRGGGDVDLVAGDQLVQAGLSVASVHMGQGSERDVIILSTVRSTDASRMPQTEEGGSLAPDQARRTLGFVAQEQLMNVAITRAREALLVVGDCNTLQLHSMWAEWLSEVRMHNSLGPKLTLRDSLAPWGDDG